MNRRSFKLSNSKGDAIMVDEEKGQSPEGLCSTKGKKAKKKHKKTGKGGNKRKAEAGKTEAGQFKKPHLDRKKYPTLKKRTSPSQFLTAIRELKPKQIYAVRRFGFGKLLSFGMDGIPGKLAYFLVDSFNPKTMQLEIGNHKLKVNREVVHRFLGVPNEGVDFKSLPVLKKNNDGIAGVWKSLYPPFLSPSDIVAHIKESNDDDSKLFEIDFGMLFILTIIDCHQNGKSKAEFTNVISDDFDVKKINWCLFIIDKLKHCKESWNPEVVSSFFCGPLLILLLLYVESFKCPVIERPPEKLPTSFWNLDQLQNREMYEIANGGFGKGELIEAPTGIHENEDHGAAVIQDTYEIANGGFGKGELIEAPTRIHENEDHGAAVIQNPNIQKPPCDREELLRNKKEFVKRRLELLLIDKKGLEAELKDLFETSSNDAEVRLLANRFGSIIGECSHWLAGTNDDRHLATHKIQRVSGDLRDRDKTNNEETANASSFWESSISTQVPKDVERDQGGPSFGLNLSQEDEDTEKTAATNKDKGETKSEPKGNGADPKEQMDRDFEGPSFSLRLNQPQLEERKKADVDEVGNEKKEGLDAGDEKMADHGVPLDTVIAAELLIEFASGGLKDREAEVQTTTSSVMTRFRSRGKLCK